jgi:large subunit ribosomal protein L6
MSRIGKKPIPVPSKVSVSVEKRAVTVKGPKGELKIDAHPNMSVKVEDGNVVVERPDDERQNRALHGLTRALIANMVEGVSTGFRKSLQIEGVGYTSDLRGKDLVLKLGFSHEVVVKPPENITFVLEDRGRVIHIDGIDKQVVGQVAANIRELRPPEPYLGKGVRYSDEIIRRKAGKTGK